MIVIDVGCARYGGDFSIERLISEFQPSIIYGFDPNQGPDDYPWPKPDLAGPTGPTRATNIVIQKKAAWVHDGEIGFVGSGLGGRIQTDAEHKVPCVDLARFIFSLEGEEIVLKIDAEGSEYALLDYLIETDADTRLKLAWVEWHPFGTASPEERRRSIEKRIACELVEWRW